ncbi:MAG: hypothetical protein RLZZ337_1915 [Bacteroidota bacterium]|jgi:hypothetical protein
MSGKVLGQASKNREPNIDDKAKLTPQSISPFDTNSAKSFFADYAQELLKQKRRSLASFLADPIIEVRATEVIFTVGSKNVAVELEEETQKFIKVAAEKGWQLTTVSTKVNAAQVSEYKVFTPKQQFDVMAKEYPILKEFESRFNLDFDA